MENTVRVALVGVGNCASALVQGVHYYKEAHPGLMHWSIDDYLPSSIEFSAAFDVDVAKVGKTLDVAIHAGENNTYRFSDVPTLPVTVQASPVFDGLGRRYSEKITPVDSAQSVDVVRVLRESKTDVVVNYLPVGSYEATRWWAERAIEAKCAFVNCIPEFIASEESWQKRFQEAGVPLIGDDVKSQFGATIVHRVLAQLLAERGIKLERTYQLNFGGNMDFYNMLNDERLTTKRESKKKSVESIIPGGIPAENIHISPSDYVQWLGDQKMCHIRLDGSAFGGVPLRMELKLEVWDSPNSAGVVLDAVRWAKVAMDRGLAGPVEPVCSVSMKSPPNQITDDQAAAQLADWCNTHDVSLSE
ncbi:MAG: inositol-3-phosphate synthase [Pirellulales bacterium]|nr:inositol-3-phosphate synthase [Pirellulales bacterium]